jgi:succinate-semialdehyde dehydrogenase/glutarate-semialdehyde dehydrogenase
MHHIQGEPRIGDVQRLAQWAERTGHGFILNQENTTRPRGPAEVFSKPGFFFQPTVITDVPDDSKIMTEEPFGPLAPIVPFKTFDEVVERANSLQFGLAAYAFTTSDKNASAISDALQSGMVGVNSIAISTPETPFGGIKESGYGSEGGIEGLQAYMNTKFVPQA